MTSRSFTITQVRAKFDVTARALRFYESKGLISPQRDGVHRLYSPNDVRRISAILRAKQYGLTLSEIADLLNAPATESSAQKIRAILERQLALLVEQHTKLGRTIESLRTELHGAASNQTCHVKTAA